MPLVGKLKSKPILTCKLHDRVQDILAKMAIQNMRAAPVVDDNGVMINVITVSDVNDYLYESPGNDWRKKFQQARAMPILKFLVIVFNAEPCLSHQSTADWMQQGICQSVKSRCYICDICNCDDIA